jgi:hypothetical protein
MDHVPVFATVALIVALATLVLGMRSYLACRAREQRRSRAAPTTRKAFFVRLGLPAAAPPSTLPER